MPARTLLRERGATDSSLDRLLRDKRQLRLLPRVEASHYVDHILKTGSLQQAACDHAAIPALAVNGDGKVAIDFGRRDLEVIERPPGCACDVPRIPFRLAADVQHLQALALQPAAESFNTDLWKRGQGKSRLSPSFDAAIQISAGILETD